MWIKNGIKNFIFTLFCTTLLLSACGTSNSSTIDQKYSQSEIEYQFKQAQNLFDENKYDDAYKIFENLAEQGDAGSQVALGNGYEYGYWGNVDLKQAEYWYAKAAEQNYVEGIHNLGVVKFEQGEYEESLPYFNKGAKLNNPPSINMIGVYHSQGILFKKDRVEALKYFYKAAKYNDPSAQFNIGQSYYKGEGVERNYHQAFQWYSKSAAQDYSLAQIQLAEMYYTGKSVEQNTAKAIEIISPLAEQGDEKAQSNLKWYLEHPDGD